MSEEFIDCCNFCGNEECSCLDPDINPDSPNYGKVILSVEEWEHHFFPIDNPIDFENASFDGMMFETYGEDYDFVAEWGQRSPNSIWTYIDKEDGSTCIINRWAFVNRIGYFITTKPYDDMLDIEVQLDQE